MKLKLFFLIVMCSLISFAQSNISFQFDYSQFGYDSTSNFIEFYYSLDKLSLVSKNIDTNSVREAILGLELIDKQTKRRVLKENYLLQDTTSVNDKIESSLLIGQLRYNITPSEYELHVKVTDKNDTTREFSKNYNFQSVAFKSFINKVSDIQLSINIVNDKTEENEIFDKNTYTIFPLPSLVLTSRNPKLYYYTELYNLNSDEKYVYLRQRIIDNIGKIIFSRKLKRKNGLKAKVEVGILSTEKLVSGVYNLEFALVDSTNRIFSKSEKTFYYYNSADTTSTVAVKSTYLNSEFAVYSEEECDELMDGIRYVAIESEIDQYSKLKSLTDKRRFLYEFWMKRGKGDEASGMEYKNEIMTRIDYCNAAYGTINTSGAKTDRGRIYILYGEPDDIDRHPNDVSYKPYEIWRYDNIEGGVIFVFGDQRGFDEYRLLHSTKRNEITQPNWQSLLRNN